MPYVLVPSEPYSGRVLHPVILELELVSCSTKFSAVMARKPECVGRSLRGKNAMLHAVSRPIVADCVHDDDNCEFTWEK